MSMLIRFILIALGLCVCELALRLIGFTPFSSSNKTSERPVLYQPDAVLGWVHKPLSVVNNAWPQLKSSSLFRSNSDGSRFTAETKLSSEKKLLMLGCSYMEGYGLSDQQTLAWKIQEKFPRLQVINHGVSAYGTLQALLLMKKLLQEDSSHPRIFVYGLVSGHELRNVADSNWQANLINFNLHSALELPYCEVDDALSCTESKMLRLPRAWFLSERLSLARLGQELKMNLTSPRNLKAALQITKTLILQMQKISSEAGAEFMLMGLALDQQSGAEFDSFFKQAPLSYFNCSAPMARRAELSLSDDPHPNQLQNSLWAECLAAELRQKGI